MKRWMIIICCLLLLTACTDTPSNDADTQEQETYEATIRELEIQLDSANDTIDLLTSLTETLEEQLAVLTDEVEALRQVISVNADVETSADEQQDTNASEMETLDQLQIRQDIPISPYTLAELAEIHKTVEDGADLNTYGAAVVEKYFELGMSTFIHDIAEIDTMEKQDLMTQVFVYAIVSFRDIYYVDEVPIETFQRLLEKAFTAQLALDLSADEQGVVQMILQQILATYQWYN